jgi:hypothetical protein
MMKITVVLLSGIMIDGMAWYGLGNGKVGGMGRLGRSHWQFIDQGVLWLVMHGLWSL